MATTPRIMDEQELLHRYHVDGDRKARQELAERMLPYVRRIARRYANRGESLDDLVQVGCVGLLKAIDRFDISRGVQLRTFAEPNVTGEIRRHFRDHGWSVHMPRDLQELNAGIVRETERLGGSLGRAPTVNDLAERLEASPEAIVQAMLGARSYNASSLDEPDETGESRIAALGAPDAEFGRADQLQLLRVGAASLPQRERRIVYLRFFHELRQHEIAHVMGISQMHVSRLLRSSLVRMREAMLEGGAPEATLSQRAA